MLVLMHSHPDILPTSISQESGRGDAGARSGGARGDRVWHVSVMRQCSCVGLRGAACTCSQVALPPIMLGTSQRLAGMGSRDSGRRGCIADVRMLLQQTLDYMLFNLASTLFDACMAALHSACGTKACTLRKPQAEDPRPHACMGLQM